MFCNLSAHPVVRGRQGRHGFTRINTDIEVCYLRLQNAKFNRVLKGYHQSIACDQYG